MSRVLAATVIPVYQGIVAVVEASALQWLPARVGVTSISYCLPLLSQIAYTPTSSNTNKVQINEADKSGMRDCQMQTAWNMTLTLLENDSVPKLSENAPSADHKRAIS